MAKKIEKLQSGKQLKNSSVQERIGSQSVPDKTDGLLDFNQIIDLPRNRSNKHLQNATMLQLQRHYGNDFVQRMVIQREEGEVTESTSTEEGTEEDATSFKTVGTDYGTFAVYPDDFIGPLEVADPTGVTPWPVRQGTFDKIKEAIDAIASGKDGFKISGKKAFKSAVLMDMAWLMTQSLGYLLLESIVKTGFTVTIVPTTGGNSESGDADGFMTEDGKKGPGCNTSVKYNIGEWNPYGGDEKWMTRPPAIGLAHELIHAYVDMMGMTPRGKTDKTPNYELQTTGLGEYEDEIFTENKFREAFGLPKRPRY